jgi:hypothetical protein
MTAASAALHNAMPTEGYSLSRLTASATFPILSRPLVGLLHHIQKVFIEFRHTLVCIGRI